MKTLILDIETLPQGAREYRALCANTGADWRTGAPAEVVIEAPKPPPPSRGKVPSNYKSPATIAKAEAKIEEKYRADMAGYADACIRAALEWWREGSLRPSRGEVYCVGVQDAHTGERSMICESTELDTLIALQARLLGDRPSERVRRIVAWNAPFDGGFIFTRAMFHGLIPLAEIVGGGMTPYALQRQLGIHPRTQIIDAADLWHSAGRRPLKGERRQATVTRILAIDGGEQPIDGSQVLDAYMDGRDEEIRAHCGADVAELAEIWNRVCRVYGIGVAS